MVTYLVWWYLTGLVSMVLILYEDYKAGIPLTIGTCTLSLVLPITFGSIIFIYYLSETLDIGKVLFKLQSKVVLRGKKQ